ncbi:glycosyltransferase [Leeuwenhoekiella sp. NPDC079379]|uniref:glycosyltransferase n=1 Tax=Leeuwenhoekiella sp. NPDC079379 TaxID=3364122 RepID=UPI0037C78865
MKYRFLIYISHTYGIPIGEPLEEEIKRLGYEVKWFADLEYTQKAISGKAVCNTVEEAIYYHPHIVLTATDSVAYFIPGIKVQIFHGFLANKHSMRKGHFRIRSFFDLYCTQGPSTTSVFNEKKKKLGFFEVVETGWSKVDPLFPLVPKPVTEKPVIFIASTFSPKYSLAYQESMIQEIKRLSETGRYRFLCVLHPKLPEHIINQFKQLEGPDFTYYNTTDLMPLFKKADLMLADTTSAITEFILQEKPVITFNNSKPGPHFINIEKAEDLETAIIKAVEKPAGLMTAIKNYIQITHPYFDGKSSKRVIEATIDFLHKDKSYLKKKPLNLVRKYKMRKLLNYKPLKWSSAVPTLPKIENRKKLSVLIPTFNEEANLEQALQSVDFADEIIIVDSFSTDKTLEIAKRYSATILQRNYENSASQKNWAIPQATHKWILIIDADERITPSLKDEILITLQNPDPELAGYWIYRRNHFKNKVISYSGWQNDKVIRLFKHDQCKYENKSVHAEIKCTNKIGILQNKIDHFSFKSEKQYVDKLRTYAFWQAKDYDKITGKLTAYHFILKPCWRFFKHYVLQQGFRDGLPGYTISKLQAYAVRMRYIELRNLRNIN